MQEFFAFWYAHSFPWAFERYKRAIATFDGQLAVGTTWHNISKPLFQDYTWEGRFIGFFLRIFRIFFGLLLYGGIALAYALLYLFWLLFPLFCLMAILGFFLGTTPRRGAASETAPQSNTFYQQ